MIKTYNLTVSVGHNVYNHYNISRVAVKRYLEWYKENEEFNGYTLDDA